MCDRLRKGKFTYQPNSGEADPKRTRRSNYSVHPEEAMAYCFNGSCLRTISGVLVSAVDSAVGGLGAGGSPPFQVVVQHISDTNPCCELPTTKPATNR